MKRASGSPRRWTIQARLDNLQLHFCQTEAKRDGFESSAEFVRWLIDEEQKRRRIKARRQQRQTEAQKETGL